MSSVWFKHFFLFSMAAVKINSHEGECHSFVCQGEGTVAKIIVSDLKAKTQSWDSMFKSQHYCYHTQTTTSTTEDTRVITPHRYDHMCSNVNLCLQ